MDYTLSAQELLQRNVFKTIICNNVTVDLASCTAHTQQYPEKCMLTLVTHLIIRLSATVWP